MNLTENQLNKIKELSGLFLSPSEIAVLLDLDIAKFNECINNQSSDIYKYYLLGKSETKQAIRTNVLKMARNGSPAAEELAEKYMKEQQQQERNNARKNSFNR